MSYFKDESVPVVFDFQGLIKALLDKEAEAAKDEVELMP